MHRVAVIPQPFTLGLCVLRVGNAPAQFLLVVSCIALAGFLHHHSCRFLASLLQISVSRKCPQAFGMVRSAELAQTRPSPSVSPCLEPTPDVFAHVEAL